MRREESSLSVVSFDVWLRKTPAALSQANETAPSPRKAGGSTCRWRDHFQRVSERLGKKVTRPSCAFCTEAARAHSVRRGCNHIVHGYSPEDHRPSHPYKRRGTCGGLGLYCRRHAFDIAGSIALLGTGKSRRGSGAEWTPLRRGSVQRASASCDFLRPCISRVAPVTSHHHHSSPSSSRCSCLLSLANRGRSMHTDRAETGR